MFTVIHRYRAGMPQLAHTGIAENWLLKECGQRHWEALAAQAGRDVPEFFDDQGKRAYASFIAVRIDMHPGVVITENEMFHLQITLSQVGSIRHFSEQRVLLGAREAGVVRMLSAFITREQAGNNRTVVKARMRGLDGPVEDLPAEALSMIEVGKKLRAGEASALSMLSGIAPARSPVAEFLPCPNGDFNGADLLYFASFQAFVDRAEWQRHRFARVPFLVGRQLNFHGNLDIGDTLVVRTAGERADTDGLSHWSEIVRGSDGVKIADVVTEKCWERS